MMNFQAMALDMIRRNPQIANNPNAQELLNVIQSGDQKKAEEWICNFIADYGLQIFETAYSVSGDDAWTIVPQELDRMIA